MMRQYCIFILRESLANDVDGDRKIQARALFVSAGYEKERPIKVHIICCNSLGLLHFKHRLELGLQVSKLLFSNYYFYGRFYWHISKEMQTLLPFIS